MAIEIPENWREIILEKADTYCNGAQIKRSVLSARAFKDADFLDHLAGGGGCGVEKVRKVITWFDNNPAPQLASSVQAQERP